MEYDPPIHKRTTEQLLDIVETQEQWKDDVVAMAQSELTKRGIPQDKQEDRRRKRKVREASFLRRTLFIKENATYTNTEKILIILIGPVLAFVFDDLFMFHAGKGYKKKNRQGLFYFLLGIVLWGYLLYTYIMNFE